MAGSVIASATSPTGYVNDSGTIVNADGSAYNGAGAGIASGSYNPITTGSSGLTALTPSTTGGTKIDLSGMPTITESANQIAATQYNPQPMQSIQEQPPTVKLASGGLGAALSDDYAQTGFPRLHPSFSKGSPVSLYGTPGQHLGADMSGHLIGIAGHADGGAISNIPDGHEPQFFSEGGLQHAYVRGEGDGTSDSVPAMLAAGEFVVPADVVSSLGNGDNDAGAKTLAEFLKTIREHKRAADAKHLPPDSKGPLAYLTDAKRKVKA